MTAAIHPGTHFIAPDADGDLTLWRGTREDPAPVAVLRECDTDPAVWAMVVAAVSTPDRLTDEEREALANAADERGWAMQSNQVSDEVLAHADATFWAAVERILAARGVRAPGDTTADRDALAPLDALLHDWGGREVTDVEHAMIREAADALAQAHHRLAAQPPACFGKVWDVDCGEMTARVERVRRFVDHPGNWSAGEARRRVILDLLDGKDVPGLAADGLVQP